MYSGSHLFSISDAQGRYWQNWNGELHVGNWSTRGVYQLQSEDCLTQQFANWGLNPALGAVWAIRQVGGSFVRHGGYVMWVQDLMCNYDYAYQFQSLGGDDFSIFNPFGGGIFVGEDGDRCRIGAGNTTWTVHAEPLPTTS